MGLGGQSLYYETILETSARRRSLRRYPTTAHEPEEEKAIF